MISTSSNGSSVVMLSQQVSHVVLSSTEPYHSFEGVQQKGIAISVISLSQSDEEDLKFKLKMCFRSLPFRSAPLNYPTPRNDIFQLSPTLSQQSQVIFTSIFLKCYALYGGIPEHGKWQLSQQSLARLGWCSSRHDHNVLMHPPMALHLHNRLRQWLATVSLFPLLNNKLLL